MQSGVALVTQRRKDAEAHRGVSGRGSGHHLVTGNQVLQGPSFPCLLASLRLCVESSLHRYGLAVTIQSGVVLLTHRHSAAEPQPERQANRFNAEVAESLQGKGEAIPETRRVST